MKPTFDLVHAPWIPCTALDGEPIELGLLETLVRAHELRELQGDSPLVTAALYRLLLAVLHRVFGPEDDKAWAELWDAGHWDAGRLEAYLGEWRHRFDLFDTERPFYQAPDDRVRPKSVSSLIHDVASGNNPVLFDHHTDDGGITLTPAQAARMLVAAQVFGMAGLCSPGLPNFTEGACTRGIVFIVQGDTLFETLALNLLLYPDEDTMQHSLEDRPAWEMDDPFAPDRVRPLGYLDYLTWQNRRVLFLPEDTHDGAMVRRMTVAPALRLDNSVLDPMTHYRRDDRRGPVPLAFREGRALWRDSAALFQIHKDEYRPPQAFRWLAELVYGGILEGHQTRRYVALGMSKKQAKVYFYRCEHMPLPLEYLRNLSLVQALQTAIEMAEGTSRQLWGAARTLATLILSPEADTDAGRKPASEDVKALTEQWAVERRYWSRLELPFRETLEALPEEPEAGLDVWAVTLRKTAWAAFGAVADNLGYDPRTLKAVVRARGQLAAGLGKALPNSGPASQ